MNRTEPENSNHWGPWSAWRAQHRVAAVTSWQKMVARPGATWLTWIVLAISLALPSAILLTLDNLRETLHGLSGAPQISVLLSLESNLAAADALREDVEAWPEVAIVSVVDRARALAEFIESSGFNSLPASLARNPLPHTLLVTPAEGLGAQAVARLATRLEAEVLVAQVVVDARWLERLEQMLRLGSRWVQGLGGAMILGAILVLANTLRLAVDARREEIQVVRLMGGSDAFARRPFLYTGVWYGAGGGLMATILVWGFGLWLSGPVNALLLIYDRPTQLLWLGPQYPLALILGSACLGWLAAWWVTERFFGH